MKIFKNSVLALCILMTCAFFTINAFSVDYRTMAVKHVDSFFKKEVKELPKTFNIKKMQQVYVDHYRLNGMRDSDISGTIDVEMTDEFQMTTKSIINVMSDFKNDTTYNEEHKFSSIYETDVFYIGMKKFTGKWYRIDTNDYSEDKDIVSDSVRYVTIEKGLLKILYYDRDEDTWQISTFKFKRK